MYIKERLNPKGDARILWSVRGQRGCRLLCEEQRPKNGCDGRNSIWFLKAGKLSKEPERNPNSQPNYTPSPKQCQALQCG